MKNQCLLIAPVLTAAMLIVASCSVKQIANVGNSNQNANITEKTAQPEAASGTASVNQDIRKVDFKNFTYEPDCAYEDNKKITVKNGEYSFEKPADGYADRFDFQILDMSYGDLNADNSEEAVILTTCNTGGTGNFTEGFIYTLKDGKPILFGKIPGGDRADGGLRTAKVDNGQLIVESNDPSETGGACCPEFILTTHYDVSTGKLKQVGKVDRRPVFSTERVKFDKGATSTHLTVHLPVEEGRRYVLGARSGQTLEASTNNEQAAIRLLDNDDATQSINMFTAHLVKTGEYTIEVSNTSSKPLDVTVFIKIY